MIASNYSHKTSAKLYQNLYKNQRIYKNRCFTQRTTPLGCPEIDLSLYLVTDARYGDAGELYRKVKRFIQAGGSTVQLRFKEENLREYLELALSLSHDMPTWTDRATTLVINDRVDVSKALEANIKAVHLGPTDFPPELAKKVLGENSIIGYTVNSLKDVLYANKAPVDYIGVQIFPSQHSREQSPKVWDIQGTLDVLSISKKRAVLIGGINRKTIGETLKCLRPNDGVAIVGDILMYEDPFDVTQEYLSIINAHLEGLKKKQPEDNNLA